MIREGFFWGGGMGLTEPLWQAPPQTHPPRVLNAQSSPHPKIPSPSALPESGNARTEPNFAMAPRGMPQCMLLSNALTAEGDICQPQEAFG